MTLTSAQQAALEHVAAYARSRRESASFFLEHVRRMCDLPSSALEEALDNIRRCAQVALHFHPERPGPGGVSVAQGLLEEGRYCSQFETGLSNGGLTAHPGGRRDMSELRLFGGAYQRDGISAAERPKYGSLDLLRHADGPSPRFGSCYFLLYPSVAERCTYTYLDSHEDPIEQGTQAEFADVAAALFREAFGRDSALGERDLGVVSLVRRLREELPKPSAQRSPNAARNLNLYIEAQVHGEIALSRDVEALIADPSFLDTRTGDVLRDLARRHGFALRWHPGFVLRASDVPRDFRGPSMPSLAARVASFGIVDASAIGAAVWSLRAEPQAWRDRGSFEEVLQELKLLWHVLVKYGRPFAARQL